MKLSRRLIPAIAMLMVSAVLMSTASFAWFSMRDTVTAEGMTVNATSDAVFLQIKEAEQDEEAYDASVTVSYTASLLPVAHDAFGEDGVLDYAKWYFGYSTDPTDADAGFQKITEKVNGDNFSKYVGKMVFNVKLTADTPDNTSAYSIQVSQMTISGTYGLTVIIVGDDGLEEFTATRVGSEDIIAGLEKNEEATVTAYFFIDGSNANVTTENIEKDILKKAAVNFALKATVVESASED